MFFGLSCEPPPFFSPSFSRACCSGGLCASGTADGCRLVEFLPGFGKRWGRYHTAAICCLILWPWPWASFARDGSRMFGAGVNFSSKAQTIDEWIIQGHDLSSDEAIQRVVAFAEMGGLGLIVDTPWSPIMRKPIGRLDA